MIDVAQNILKSVVLVIISSWSI